MSRKFIGIDTDSLTFRGLSVAVLALLMLVPVSMVRGVIDERYELYQGVVQEVGSEWGGEQMVIGPVMLIPITERWSSVETVQSEAGEAKQIRRDQSRDDVIAVLPETLAIDASLDAERRQRGIYEAMVYTSQVALKGRFAPPDIATPPGRVIDVRWEDATLAIGVSAPVGIYAVDTPLIAGGARSAEPGSQLAALPQGMHWRLLDAKALANNGEFSIDVSLHGSAQIAFAPIGATTQAHIASKWPHPGFIGAMPTQRAIAASGFSADWSVSSLSRSYPQMFSQSSAPQSLNEVSLGVRLVQPVFLYSLNDRAVKYAVLFITLTFVTLLVFELVTEARVHYVQYALIGAALTMFYLLLLAFSEHIGFGAAYAIAASTVILMITAYTAAALGRWRRAVVIGAMQTVTYAVLYVILQLEDYALITGTIALLVALGTLMYFTRTLSRGQQGGPLAAASAAG
jgi:inner membrane protein